MEWAEKPSHATVPLRNEERSPLKLYMSPAGRTNIVRGLQTVGGTHETQVNLLDPPPPSKRKFETFMYRRRGILRTFHIAVDFYIVSVQRAVMGMVGGGGGGGASENHSESRIIISVVTSLSVNGLFFPVATPHWMQEKSTWMYVHVLSGFKLP